VKIDKIILSMICVAMNLFGATAEQIYTKNCVVCHDHLPSSLEKMFMSYIKTYSGEKDTKEAIKSFLKKPNMDNSVMSELFLDKYGLKKPTKLNDKALESAIEYYFQKYKIKGRLN